MVKLPEGSFQPNGSDVSYTVDRNGEITFKLKFKQRVVIDEIPVGTKATIEETGHFGYTTHVTLGGSAISNNDETTVTIKNDLGITYWNEPLPILPEAGGMGTTPFILSGLLVLLAGAISCGIYRRRKQEE